MKRLRSPGAGVAFLVVDLKRKLRFSVASLWRIVSGLVLFTVQVSLWQYIRFGTGPGEVVRYFALVAFMRPFLNLLVERAVEQRHASGEIIYDVTRPLSLIRSFLLRDIATATVRFWTVSLPSISVISLVYDLAGLTWARVPLFAASLVLAFAASWFTAFAIGLAVFRLKDANGVLSAYNFLFPFLSGAMIPLDAMPTGFRFVFTVLPFRAAYDLPIRVLNAPMVSDAMQALGLQVCWCAVLCGLAVWVQSRGLRRLEIYGG